MDNCTLKQALVPAPTVARQLFELFLARGYQQNGAHRADLVLDDLACNIERLFNLTTYTFRDGSTLVVQISN